MNARTTMAAATLAIAGGLFFPVTSSSAGEAIQLRKAGSFYGGEFPSAPGSIVLIRAKLADGKPRRILSLYYKGLPTTCSSSGPSTLDTTEDGLRFDTGVKVGGDRRFTTVANSTTGSPDQPGTTEFVGRFSRKFKTITGTVRSTQHFLAGGGFPEEDCSSETVGFSATR